ncbi:hypothetical protein T484DRAFT_1780715 [Baffinella frigidus]|nr:hypothetical protein T484DRAFT_1780715 [Cryptophyta sp. CCMP2293]
MGQLARRAARGLFLRALLALAACGAAADGRGGTLDVGLDENTSSRGTFCSGCPLIHTAHISVAYTEGTPRGACAITLRFGVSGHHVLLGAQTCRSPDTCQQERAATALGASAALDGRRTHPAGECASDEDCTRLALSAAVSSAPSHDSGGVGAARRPGAIACHEHLHERSCVAAWALPSGEEVQEEQGNEHRVVLSLSSAAGLPVAADLRDFSLSSSSSSSSWR